MQRSAAEARNKNRSAICFDYEPEPRAPAPEAPKGEGVQGIQGGQSQGAEGAEGQGWGSETWWLGREGSGRVDG